MPDSSLHASARTRQRLQALRSWLGFERRYVVWSVCFVDSLLHRIVVDNQRSLHGHRLSNQTLHTPHLVLALRAVRMQTCPVQHQTQQ